MKSPRAAIRSIASAFGRARTASDAKTIEAAITEAKVMIAEGERDEAAAGERYRSALLDDDADPEAHLAEQRAAKVRRERGEAQVADLTIWLGDLRAGEARAAREAVHADAVVKCEAIKARLPVEYRSHALAIRGLLRDLAEAEAAIGRAATEAPDFPAIPSPEADLRTLYGLPEEIVERAEVRLFVVDGRTDPVPVERQGDVRRSPEHPHRGTFYLAGMAHPFAPTSGVALTCTERSFTRTRYREPVEGFRQEALHRTVSLPGFGLNEPAFVTADPLRDYSGALVELSSDLPPPVGRPDRPIHERLELIPEPPSTREAIVPNERREPERHHQPSATQIREANTPSRIAAAERQAG